MQMMHNVFRHTFMPKSQPFETFNNIIDSQVLKYESIYNQVEQFSK